MNATRHAPASDPIPPKNPVELYNLTTQDLVGLAEPDCHPLKGLDFNAIDLRLFWAWVLHSNIPKPRIQQIPTQPTTPLEDALDRLVRWVLREDECYDSSNPIGEITIRHTPLNRSIIKVKTRTDSGQQCLQISIVISSQNAAVSDGSAVLTFLQNEDDPDAKPFLKSIFHHPASANLSTNSNGPHELHQWFHEYFEETQNPHSFNPKMPLSVLALQEQQFDPLTLNIASQQWSYHQTNWDWRCTKKRDEPHEYSVLDFQQYRFMRWPSLIQDSAPQAQLLFDGSIPVLCLDHDASQFSASTTPTSCDFFGLIHARVLTDFNDLGYQGPQPQWFKIAVKSLLEKGFGILCVQTGQSRQYWFDDTPWAHAFMDHLNSLKQRASLTIETDCASPSRNLADLTPTPPNNPASARARRL